MLRDIPIKFLLIAGFLFSGLLPLMAVALSSLSVAKEEMNNQAFQHLESVRDIKKLQLERFFEESVRHTEVMAADPYVGDTIIEFEKLRSVHGSASMEGLKERRYRADDEYVRIHDRHFDYFRRYSEGHDYYDVFLMSRADGFTYFTVEKEADFGIPIARVESSLRDVWRTAANDGKTSVSDTRPYAPSGGIPAQFIAAPVVRENKLLGVVAVQISFDAIALLMNARPGMGDTGETYLVGPDNRMRSDSFLDPENRSVTSSFAGNVEGNGVSTEAVKEAFAGRTYSKKLTSYHGNTVLSAYAPMSFHGLTWAIVAEVDEREIDAKIAEALNPRITIIIFTSLALLLFLALAISLFISKGIGRVNSELNLLMDGVLSGESDRRGNPDEVTYDFRGVVRKTNDLINAYQEQTEESRRLEEVIAYNQRMESLGTLAGGIAHDFNNILAYMLTYGDLVLDDLEDGSLAKERMEEILKGIDRAGELVAQIMAFGKQLKKDRRPVDFTLIVKEAAKLLKATLPKNIKVNCTVQSGPSKVMADPPQLHSIVMNLCTNSYHSMMGEGGELAMELAREEGEGGEPGSCMLTVADTGCGIEPETMERIFEPFFTTKPVGQGSGMGLAVVHGIVTSYEGTVTVDSEPMKGTIAVVRLPLCEHGIQKEEPEDGGRVVRGRGRLLFVDDEEPICMSVSSMLESIGYQVDTSTNPESALAVFASNPGAYETVISDINMPGMSGAQLATEIREIAKDVPIMFVTGYNDKELGNIAAFKRSCVVSKPFRKGPFSRALAELKGELGNK